MDDLYIDGLNAFGEWGVYVTEDGYRELLGMPPLKEPQKNDWWEDDGEEVDLSAPRLDTREVTIKVACAGGDFDGFVSALNKGALHTVRSKALGRSWSLRYTRQSALDYCDGLTVASLRFSEDSPLDGYTYAAPQSTYPGSTDYSIDGKPLAAYGVRVLAGTLAGIKAVPDVKVNLLRNIKTQGGAQYDGAKVHYKSKSVRLYCLMRAADAAELWRNRDALLYDLTRPQARTLEVAALGCTFECYYNKSSVETFISDDAPWLAFSLFLTVTGGLRSETLEVTLVTEDDRTVVTEDGRLVTIDIINDGR